MAAPWELVLHHDYRGVPGVVFDSSPGRGAHGQLRKVNVPGDFQADGTSAGTGAIRLRGGDSAVRVTLPRPWTVLNGINIAMVCSKDIILRPGTLLDSDSFTLDVGPQGLRALFKTPTSTFESIVRTDDPGGQWVRIGVTYNFGAHLGYEGDMSMGFSTDFQWRGPLKPIRQLAIGNRLSGGNGVVGLIDDVQFQRLDPLQIDHNFRSRPVDDSVRHCWDDWGRELLRLLNENRECALEIIDLLRKAQSSVTAAALGGGDYEIISRVKAATESYATHWDAGALDQIPDEATALVGFLQGKGIDLAANRDLRALLQSKCFRDLVDRMPTMTCDPEFTGMLSAIATGVQ